MSDMLAIPRRPRDIMADIRSQQDVVSHVRHLLGEFAALDTRPLRIIGDVVEPIGPDPIPENLRALYVSEMTTLRTLEYEFVSARDTWGLHSGRL